jgi:hypothetical protein
MCLAPTGAEVEAGKQKKSKVSRKGVRLGVSIIVIVIQMFPPFSPLQPKMQNSLFSDNRKSKTTNQNRGARRTVSNSHPFAGYFLLQIWLDIMVSLGWIQHLSNTTLLSSL